jgi:glycosyltransferase involved in cell wall biosynthesis
VVVLFVGNLLRHKGLHRVVRALAEVGGNTWRLVVVGTGPEGERCRARLASLGLSDRATFLGALSPRDVETVLAAGDILALPSTMEGMPYVVLEAMASGIPVVVNKVFGIPEMVEDGVHGFVVEPGDTSAFSRALARLIDDAELRSEMGAAARARFLREFTLSRQVSAIESVYRELAGGRARR